MNKTYTEVGEMLADTIDNESLRAWIADLWKDRRELTEKVRDARRCARECARYVPGVQFNMLTNVWPFLDKAQDDMYPYWKAEKGEVSDGSQ